MKITDTYGAQNVQVSNYQETAPAKQAKDVRRQDRTAARGGDQVRISDASRRAAGARAAATSAPDVRSQKVEALRARVADGTYQVDARRVADRILIETVKDLV